MIIEFVKLIIYAIGIVLIAKYILVKVLRNLAETIGLSPKMVGNIAGVATSVPELLTVCFSASTGLLQTSIFNILSSNIINLVQYIASIFFSKNQNILKNKGIQICLVLVMATIVIPIAMEIFSIPINLYMVPVFLIAFILFYKINAKTHHQYLQKNDKKLEEKIEQEEVKVRGQIGTITKYAIYLLITSVTLYIVGNELSIVLNNLGIVFAIPESILGMILGFITSIPELMTFFEAQKHYQQEEKELGVIEASNNLFISNLLNLFIIQSVGIVIYSIFS